MSPFRAILLTGAIAGSCLLGASTGHAQLAKRGFLVQTCSAKDPAKVAGCDGYIAGVADLASQADTGKADVCIAKGVKLKPVRESVVSYMESHPGTADSPAAPAVLEALRTLYKC